MFDAAFHAQGLGSSDVAAIVGLSKWRGPWDVWLEKTGRAAVEREDSEAQALGKALEPVVLALYGQQQGVKVLPSFRAFDRERPWRRAQLDGAVDGAPIGLEAKTAGIVGYTRSAAWGATWSDQIPQAYLCQCHWQLAVVPQWERVHVPVLLAGRGFQVYEVSRNREFEEWLTGECDFWWKEFVLANKEPPVDCSDECGKYLAEIHPLRPEAQWLESTPALDEVATMLRDVRDSRKELEAQEELLKNRLRSAIGDARGLRGDWGAVLWASSGRGGRRLLPKFNSDHDEETSA